MGDISLLDGQSSRDRARGEVQECTGVTRGVGRASAHFGELFQGKVHDATGCTRRCLVSLPFGGVRSIVTFDAAPGVPLTIAPQHKRKVQTAISIALEYLDARNVGGTATVDSTIQQSKGYGSSTADCVAAVRAVADALDRWLTEEEVAALVVRSEKASDNTMFQHAVLFAHREGVVLEYYSRPLPALEVLGFDTEPHGGVDTLEFPPAEYSRDEIEIFDTLASALRRAIRTQDVRLVGHVATASAVLNQRFLPKPVLAEVARITEIAGGLGIAVAHSGTVLGILLDPAGPRLPYVIDRIRLDLETLQIRDVVQFSTTASDGREGLWPQTRQHS